MYRIADATAHDDFTVTIRWQHGPTSVVDFKPTIAKGGVCVVLGDGEFFVGSMHIGEDGDYLGWPEEIDFCADSLWYRTNPEDLKRDHPGAVAE